MFCFPISVNWSPSRVAKAEVSRVSPLSDEGLKLETLTLETLYSGQFVLLTQLIKQN